MKVLPQSSKFFQSVKNKDFTVDPIYAIKPAIKWLRLSQMIFGMLMFAYLGSLGDREAGGLDIVFHVIALSITLFLGGVVILSLIGWMRGFPRLTATSAGVQITMMFDVQWAEWSSLTPFANSTMPGLRWGRVPVGKAQIVGPAVSPNMLRNSDFVINDNFSSPIKIVVEILNNIRP